MCLIFFVLQKKNQPSKNEIFVLDAVVRLEIGNLFNLFELSGPEKIRVFRGIFCFPVNILSLPKLKIFLVGISFLFFFRYFFFLLERRADFTSCGGTSKETVRRSTLRYVSIQGTMKKIPGPRAPPLSKRPKRKMTARSYSCTT